MEGSRTRSTAMKKTKEQPVLVSLKYPDGTRIEARVPLYKALLIWSELEREKFIKEKLIKRIKASYLLAAPFDV